MVCVTFSNHRKEYDSPSHVRLDCKNRTTHLSFIIVYSITMLGEPFSQLAIIFTIVARSMPLWANALHDRPPSVLTFSFVRAFSSWCLTWGRSIFLNHSGVVEQIASASTSRRQAVEGNADRWLASDGMEIFVVERRDVTLRTLPRHVQISHDFYANEYFGWGFYKWACGLCDEG